MRSGPLAAGTALQPIAGDCGFCWRDDPMLIKSLRDILEQDGHVVTWVRGPAGDPRPRARARAAAVLHRHHRSGHPYVNGRKVAARSRRSRPAPRSYAHRLGQAAAGRERHPGHVDRVLSKPPRSGLRAALAKLVRPADSADALVESA